MTDLWTVSNPPFVLKRLRAVCASRLSWYSICRSVVQAGALELVKRAAKQVINELAANQELAILTFAGDVTLRSCFGDSRQDHLNAIESIVDADGVSTNLYGAMTRAYSMFEDGFFIPRVDSDTERGRCQIRSGGGEDEAGGRPSLVSGMVVVLTDGNDTAGIATLDDARRAQDGRRTLFIRVGQELDQEVASILGNVGVIEAQGGFDDLNKAVSDAIERTQKLNDAVYIAEYCSPKRAGSHQLLFTVKGNEPYLDAPEAKSCSPSGQGIIDGNAVCYRSDEEYLWCPRQSPYACPGSFSLEDFRSGIVDTFTCHQLERSAVSKCGDQCVICGQRNEEGEEAEDGFTSGLAISTRFSARNFEDSQCEELFSASMPAGSGSGEVQEPDGENGDGEGNAESPTMSIFELLMMNEDLSVFSEAIGMTELAGKWLTHPVSSRFCANQ